MVGKIYKIYGIYNIYKIEILFQYLFWVNYIQLNDGKNKQIKVLILIFKIQELIVYFFLKNRIEKCKSKSNNVIL